MMEFRSQLRLEDAGAVEALTRATGFFSAEEIAIARSLVEETLEQGDASGYYFLMADDAPPDVTSVTPPSQAPGLAGYACFGPIPATQSSYDLYWVVVSPERQRHGLGLSLLDAVERNVRGRRGQRLYVDTSSRAQYAPTRSFYLRAGYVEAAFLPDYYGPGDGKHVYVRSLSGSRADK